MGCRIESLSSIFFSFIQPKNYYANGASVDPMSQVGSSAMLVLLIAGN
jgi:hypothetical protein